MYDYKIKVLLVVIEYHQILAQYDSKIMPQLKN